MQIFVSPKSHVHGHPVNNNNNNNNNNNKNTNTNNKKNNNNNNKSLLGLRVSNCLSWESHITKLCQRTHSRLSLLNRISLFLPKPVLLRIYKQTILPTVIIIVRPCGMIVAQQ